jgi:hypothetical protein
MKKKFQFSMIILTILVVAFSFGFTEAKAENVLPKIEFVGVDHSPLVVGDTENFYMTTDYSGQVEYQILMNKIGTDKWSDITEGYLPAVDGKKPCEFSYLTPFEVGKYKLSIRVRKANTDGAESDAYGKYDSQHELQLNCVNKDDKNRVYLNDDMNVLKENVMVGEKVVIKGVNNISGMKGPYTYKLHYFDCNDGKWYTINREYGNKLEWTPSKPGVYVLDLWAMSSNSTLLPKIKANPKNSLFEGYKLKVVTVAEDKTFELKKEFFNKVAKSYNIKSSENQSKVNINVDVTGLSEEDKIASKDILPLFKNISIDMKTKSVTNKASIAKSQIDMKVNVADIEVPVSMWSDMDVTGDKPKNTAIIQMPSILSNYIPQLKGKKYLVMDSLSNGNIDMTGVDSKKIASMIQSYAPMLNEFIQKYLQQYNPPVDFIKDLGEKDITTVDGKKARVKCYEVKITNENIKEIVNYTVENLFNNEDAMKLFKDYMLSTVEMMDEADSKQAKESIEVMFKELKTTGMSEFMKSTSDAMDVVADLKLLGYKGITVEYCMDENGYIISTKGTIQLVIDLAKVNSTMGEIEKAVESKQDPIIKINIDFTSNTFNINENVVINFPEVNKENSIDYMEMLMGMMGQPVDNK